MDERTPKLLFDALESIRYIASFTSGKTQNEYSGYLLLRSAVERQFEILGEALKRIRDLDSELFENIPDAHRAISFRNLLAHGYDNVDDHLVWGISQEQLPAMRASIEAHLNK